MLVAGARGLALLVWVENVVLGFHGGVAGDSAVLDMLDHDAFKLGNLGVAMDHSTRFVLVDKKGRVRGYYSFGESDGVSRVAKDAARLESET